QAELDSGYWASSHRCTGDDSNTGSSFAKARVVVRVRYFQNPQAVVSPARKEEAIRFIVRNGWSTMVGSRDFRQSGIARRVVVGDFLWLLRITEVHNAHTRPVRSIQHLRHVVLVVNADIVRVVRLSIGRPDSAGCRIIHLGIPRRYDLRVQFIRDIDEA